METLVREKGVNSFQMFMTYKDLYMLRDSELYQVFRACRDIGAIARVHAENGELVAEGAKEALDLGITGPEGIEISRPEELEAEATHRVITIANRVSGPEPGGQDRTPLPAVRRKVVYAETTTAHATLTGLHYYHQDWFHAAAYVTVPPLRLDTNTSAYLMSLLAKHPATWVPHSLGTELPGHPTAWVPHSLGTELPGHPTAWVPHSLGTELPGHPTAWVPHSLGTLLPEHPAP
ncbi:DPYL5 protein, partial [Hydrobates tethys]|nr:DPYL5 protein [Oceanodroma tethys]